MEAPNSNRPIHRQDLAWTNKINISNSCTSSVPNTRPRLQQELNQTNKLWKEREAKYRKHEKIALAGME